MSLETLPARSGAALLDRLGVTPIINAGGPNTKHSGSRPRPECLEAMLALAPHFVQMEELILAAGRAIARIVGVEAATITSGASGGLVLQSAAAIARDDPAKIKRLPNTDGLPNELIIQRGHRFTYDNLYLVPGARLVEVGRPAGCMPEEIERAITSRTAGIIDLESSFKGRGCVPLPALVEIAHRHGLPVLCDAASVLPPRANMQRFVREGADLVIFSGGKGVRGPQSTGILLGKVEWVEYARLNNAPNPTVARALKVSKEEIAGLIAALEAFLAEDEAAETARYRAQMQSVCDELQGIPGLNVTVEHDGHDYHIPETVIRFAPDWRGPNAADLARQMMTGSPRLYLSTISPHGELIVDPMNIQDGEVEIVASTLRAALNAAAA